MFKLATQGSSNVYGIDTCSKTSIGVHVSSDTTFKRLMIYFNHYNSLLKRNILKTLLFYSFNNNAEIDVSAI